MPSFFFVWHKELLWAMSQGVHVLGAGSIGALRAAEPEAFGMVGEGRIFEAYRSGVLEPYYRPFEDDDEVAVVHAPAELGYGLLWTHLSTSLYFGPCVAGRNNLACIGIAWWNWEILFLRRAQHAALIECALRTGWPAPELQRLLDWLPLGRISQKRGGRSGDACQNSRRNFADAKE